ncbi:MAG: hypothetical protein KH452_05560 [Clostridiales bacterium]|nr:hypothetical protein [Clostridiales bacterium]
MKNKSAVIRRRALEYKYEHIKGSWEGLEELLLDSSRGIREYAAYILSRHGDLNIREYYFAHLADENPEFPIVKDTKHNNITLIRICLLLYFLLYFITDFVSCKVKRHQTVLTIWWRLVVS